jgi:predicted dehydrogenase
MECDRTRSDREALVTLMTLDPGHFHAALVQKTMYDHVSPMVYVYAPQGRDLDDHVQRIGQFNARQEQPTHWQQHVYSGPDYLATMLRQLPGNVVVIAGVNSRKTGYLRAAVDAGLNVLVDKPLCINQQGWQELKAVLASAQNQGVLLYDIMPSRYAITNILFKELVNTPAVLGVLQDGTADNPAVTKESVHHLYKYVAGHPLKRPVWYFDVTQQGEGIVDVTSHLIDQVMWECFPEQGIDFAHDIEILDARRWPTRLTRQQFERVTGQSDFPLTLRNHLDHQGSLPYSCNGEIIYTVKGIHTRVVVRWDFEAPEGGDDTHMAVTRGTRSTVRILQDQAQLYRPELYVEPAMNTNAEIVGEELTQTIAAVQTRYPGVGLQQEGEAWHVTIPDDYRIGHEAHFGLVTKTFLTYLLDGALPAWETLNILTKYYVTTHALALAQGENRMADG